MKTVVITGSARGLGFEMAKVFLNNNVNVVISDVNEENLKKAKENLESISKNASVEACKCNVTNTEDIENLIKFAKEKFSKIDNEYHADREYNLIIQNLFTECNMFAKIKIDNLNPANNIYCLLVVG